MSQRTGFLKGRAWRKKLKLAASGASKQRESV